MWAMAVVVPGIAPTDALEMPCIDDEEMIEALGSDGSHEPFRVGVGVRCPEGSLEDVGTLRPKDLVEVRYIFRIAVADELWIDPSVSEIAGDVPGLLGNPGRIGMGGDAGDPDSSAADLDEE
jgi:hypothetical protein